MKKKVLSIVLAVAMAATLFVGCSNSGEGGTTASSAVSTTTSSETSTASSTATSTTGTTSTTSATPTGTLQSMISSDEEYIIVNCLNNIEYFNAHKYGWEEAGKLFGVKTSFMGPADDDMNDMCSAFDSAIAKKPAGIAVWGYDAALDPYIQKAQDAGIPVVTYVGCTDEHGDTYIGTSQYDLGYEGAKKYAEMLGGKGKVAILTITGSDMFESRRKGFEDGFAEYPDITVVGVGDTKADSTTAVSAAKDLAVKNPDLNGFVCCDSTGAAGASTALSELGETGKVDVLGLDRNTDVLQMIQDGTITGSFAQNDISMSYWALVTLITEAHYDMPLTSDNKAAGVSVSPSYIYTSVNLITKDNVEYFLKENEVYATNNF